VIAATNKHLNEAIRNKSFREDLYYRLNVISITMPPLREIPEDIPLLVNHFIAKHKRAASAKLLEVSPEAMGKLMGYHWPGNARQLENVIQRAYALGADGWLRTEDLPQEIAHQAVETVKTVKTDTNFNLKVLEKKTIKQALREAGGNKAEAAKLLGINTTTVYRKMVKYNIEDDT
jgi:transcriptional regulator with PAS, ATPase and Fis domain